MSVYFFNTIYSTFLPYFGTPRMLRWKALIEKGMALYEPDVPQLLEGLYCSTVQYSLDNIEILSQNRELSFVMTL